MAVKIMEVTMQKRSEVRRSTIVSADVSSAYWHETLDLVAADLSPQGMYLLSEKMPEIGDVLYCSFALASENPEYRFFSEVKRINWHRRRTDRMRPGFGVEFLDVKPEKALALKKALRGLPPPLPAKHRLPWFRPRSARVSIAPPGTFASKWYDAQKCSFGLI
jgi:hypothetical protein